MDFEKRIAELESELDSLKSIRGRFDALFEHSPIGIAYHKMVYDDFGEPIDFYYISANSRFKEFTGQDPTGRLVTEVFPGIEKDRNFDWIGICGKVARTGEPVRFQQHLPPVDRWYDIQVFQDKPDHFVVSFLEITEQKKTEMALYRSSKLDAIGQLAGGIAHDFNNVLGGIFGAAEMIADDLPSEGESREFLDIIIDSAAKAAGLTQKLLTFSSHYEPVSKVVDIHDIVNDTVLLLKNTIDRRISIELELAAPSAAVVGDPSQLQSIFLNMGLNGAQAMVEGGDIGIVSRTVDFDPAYCEASSFDIVPGHYLNIEIRDSGCGIAEEHLEKIFDPFFTTKEQGKGTGLGLSTAYGVVVQHKGCVTVYSQPGDGTVFQIYLPLTEEERGGRERLPEIINGTGNILVVDDEEVMRLTSKAILEGLGYNVVTAVNGRQALDMILEMDEQFDLVLLDMIMPIMNGRDCFLELRKTQPDLPVVLCSGFSREEDLKTLKENGLKGFVRKPYLRAQLSQIVHEAMQ